MRILYISGAQGPDYLCDMLFHGLRTSLGADVVEVNRLWYMYAHEFAGGRHDKSKLYGRGFTMYGLLPDDSAIDRSEISQKIRTRHFDLVIYGSVHRCRLFLEEVLAFYPPSQVLFIDGEDHTFILSQLFNWGTYFKRELLSENPGVRPIQFAIPESRIGTVPRQKIKVQAFIDPRDTRTYIYNDEASYYGDYAESMFGLTIKKAGWDCLRHYEILANRCIPYFPDLDSCPPATMVFLPKYELLAVKKILESHGRAFFETTEGQTLWLALQQRIDLIFRRHCTTTALAHYVLETAALVQHRASSPMVQVPAVVSPAPQAAVPLQA